MNLNQNYSILVELTKEKLLLKLRLTLETEQNYTLRSAGLVAQYSTLSLVLKRFPDRKLL